MTLSLQIPEDTQRSRLSEAVYESLLEAILSGQLRAGSAISELSLSRQLEVSRTPVHEAIGQLVKDGLVTQEANCRPVVATFSATDIGEIFDMRLLLESTAARRAAENIDRDTLKQLQSECDLLRKAKSAPDFVNQWAMHDERFHSAIALASGSRRLSDDIVRYRRLHRGINRLFNTADGLRQAREEHVAILAALTKRDGKAAAEAMTTHIREWKAYHVQAAMKSER